LSTVGSIAAISMYVLDLGNIAQNVIGLSSKGISPFYLYQCLKHKIHEILLLDIGGVQPSIKVPHLLSLAIPIPPSNLQRVFENQLIDFVSKMEVNYQQIKTLECLRDMLLPKLISGDIRVEYEEVL
jgi:type I restriction enzyme S subunit